MDKKEIKKLIGDNVVIIEIGAHHGEDSVDFLNTFDKLKLFSFEPDSRCLKKISEQFKSLSEHKKRQWDICDFAISDCVGETTWYCSSGTNITHNIQDWDFSSSIKEPTGHKLFHSWCTFSSEKSVKTITLDFFYNNTLKFFNINHIDFIWMDVQGAEDKVLSGGKTILENTSYIYTEYSNIEMYKSQPNLEKIKMMLPNFDIIKDFGGDVLLKNKG